MDNNLSEDRKKKKNITDLIDFNTNGLPKINIKSDTNSTIKNIKTMNINNNSSLIKFDDNPKKMKYFGSKIKKKVKFFSKLNISPKKNKGQKSYIQTNSEENESARNSLIQFNNNIDIMKNIKEKDNEKIILLKQNTFRDSDIKRDNNKYLTKNLPKVNGYKNKRKFSDLSLKENNLSMYDSENELFSKNIFKTYNDFYNDNINNEKLNLRFIANKQQTKRMSKNYYRQMTNSPDKKIKKYNEFNMNIYNSKNSFIKKKTYIVQKITLKFDIDEYLKKEREKLGNQLTNNQEDYIQKFKQSFLDKSLMFIKKKKEVKQKLIKIDDVSFKEIIHNTYKSLFNKLISSKNFQRIELSLLKYFDLIGVLFFEKPNIQYILEKFFDIHKQTIKYIFNETDNDSTKKKLIIKSDFSTIQKKDNSSIEIMKINILNIKTSQDKLFINSLIIKDLNQPNYVKYSELDRQLVLILKRKKTRKKRKSSLIGFLKKNNNNIQVKKEKFQNLMSLIRDKDIQSKYEIIYNKFHKTSNYLEEWNPLLNKNMLDSRSKIIKEKMELKNFILKKKNFSIKQKYKKDMEILRNLGGNPMSKENSILRYKELKEKAKKNILYFEKLYELINRGQNELFFEEFSKLMDEIDINYINRRTDYSLLMNAIKNENLSIIEFLIKKGCKINIQNNLGNTALHIAFMINNLQIVNLLISYGANQKILNNHGLIPWECWKNYY